MFVLIHGCLMWLWLNVISKVYWFISSIKVIAVDKILKYFFNLHHVRLPCSSNFYIVIFFFNHMILLFRQFFRELRISFTSTDVTKQKNQFYRKILDTNEKGFKFTVFIRAYLKPILLKLLTSTPLHLFFVYSIYIKSQNPIFFNSFFGEKNHDYLVF